MAIIDYYPATLAADENGNIVKGAEAQVYALADTALSNPLPVTDTQGVPMTLTSSELGIFPAFRVPTGEMQIVVVSGPLKTPLTSLSVYAAAAEASASIASGNAGAAAASATAAALAYANAAAARDAAEAAAAEAQAVGTTTDAIMTGIANDPDSDFATTLNTAFAGVASANDKAILARLATLGDGDRAASVAVSQMAYADGAAWTEEFADLINWSTDGLQVTGGRVYNNGGGAGAKSGRRVLVGVNTEKFRVTATIEVVTGATDPTTLIGVTSSTASSVGGSNLYAIGLNAAGAVKVYDRGAWQDPPGLLGIAADAPLPAGRYYVTIASLTGAEVDFTLHNAAQTVYARKGVSRTSLTAALTGLGVLLGDTRDASGNGLGGIVARVGLPSLSGKPRGSRENAAHVQRHVIAGATNRGATFNFPTGFDSRKPSPIIIYAHGQGETEESVLVGATPTTTGPVVKALVDAGYLVVASDFWGTINWGAPTAVEAFEDLYRALRDKWPLAPIGVMANSMGAQVSLNTIARRVVPGILCWYGIQPACNLRAAYDGNYGANIRTAYGIASDGSDYAAKTAGGDPMLREGWEFRGIPMRIVTSPSDTSIPAAQHGLALVAKVAPFAQSVTTRDATGPHSDPSHFVPSDAVAFFQKWMPAVIGTNPAAAADPVSVLDNFTRPDSTASPGAQWVAGAGVFGVQSNAAYLVSGSTSAPWSTAFRDCAADGTASLVVGQGSGGSVSNVGLSFRGTDGNNYYGVRLTTGGNLQVYRVEGGVATQIYNQAASFTAAGTNTLTVVLSGTSITVKLNGATVTTLTQTFNATAAKAGLWALGVSPNTTIDDFSFVGA